MAKTTGNIGGNIMFENLDISLGVTSGGLPSILLEYGNNQIELLSVLQNQEVMSIIGWLKGVLGFACIAGAVICVLKNIGRIISGDAVFLGGGNE